MPMKALTLTVILLIGGAGMLSQTPQSPAQFGAAYSGLGARRQKLVDDWVARFNQVSGQKLTGADFYDGVLRESTKTTFDAITHALMTTPLTDASGKPLGDGLDLIEHIDTVRGAFKDTRGDQQFRMYARLTERAVDTLTRSQEFKRGADNTVYHKGYPANYRQQGGAPSIQISTALDGRRADVDVDYRSSGFPAAIFNGHLTASNSDVRAGDNSDRHSTRWIGFQNWWRSFFGVPLKSAPDDTTASKLALPATPRAGDKSIDVMVNDFLNAWLVEGNIAAAMGYVAPAALTCLALDYDDPAAFDRGMAPFKMMLRMKAAFDALGPHSTLAGLTLGVRLANPALRVVQQSHHEQFVVYSVPDDVAASFDCQNRLNPAAPVKASRSYGKYHGAVFYVNGPGGRDHTMVLLWAREGGFWKLVSWRAEPDEDTTRPLHTTPEVKSTRVRADATLVAAARAFLENWLIRRNYDAAFQAFSPASYACYDLARGPGDPPSTSPEDAGRRIRAALERSGNAIGQQRDLGAILVAAEPTHPAVRVMDHAYARTFSLSSLPDSFTAAASCAARAAGTAFTPDPSHSYGRGYGLTLHFRTDSGEAPVIRMMWMKDAAGWRIAAYDVEHP